MPILQDTEGTGQFSEGMRLPVYPKTEAFISIGQSARDQRRQEGKRGAGGGGAV